MYYIKSTEYYIRERKTNRGIVYDVRFRVFDERGVQTLKSLSGFASSKLAKKAYADFVAENCVTKPIAVETVKRRILFDDAYKEYVTIIKGTVKASSWITITGTLDLYVLPCFTGKYMDSITESDIYRWQDTMLSMRKPNGDPYTRNYINKVRGFFVGFYLWFASRYDGRNPFTRVKMPKAAQNAARAKIVEIWPKEEFDRFISVVDDPMYKTLFTLLFYCGCRRGEAFALSCQDYNGKTLRINKTWTNKTTDGSPWQITAAKTGKDYVVPVAKPLRAQLDSYIAETRPTGRFLFGGDKPLAAETVRHHFHAYIAQAGVTDIKLHALRHSFVSMCIHHGANYMVVASLIGDTPEQVLKTYGHLWASDKESVVALLD